MASKGQKFRPRNTPLTIEYLLTKTNQHGECLEWIGRTRGKGYASIEINGRSEGVSRVILRLLGEDLIGRLALHSCDNPKCINPKHLFVGTYTENWADMRSKGRENPGGSKTKNAYL